MVRRHQRMVVAAVLGLAALVAVAGLLVIPRAQPAPTGEIAVPPLPLMVTIGRPGRGEPHVGVATTITAHALGASTIRRLELWEGARRVDVADSATDTPAFHARWAWTPDVGGDQVLVARAIDDAGRTATSAALRVRVSSEPVERLEVVDVEVVAGETVTQTVARAGGDLPQTLTRHPDLNAGAVLPAGDVLAVVVRRVLGTPPAAHRLDDARLAAGVIGPMTPPGVAVSITDCKASLAVTSAPADASGLGIYALDPAATAFTRTATLGPGKPGTTAWSGAVSPGTWLFSVSAFNASVEVQSDLVEVAVPDACSRWQGELRLDGGRLVTNRQVDRAYFYLSVDDRPWQRVPSAPASFLARSPDGTFDARGHLPPVQGRKLALEGLGWSGTSLVELGTGTLALGDAGGLIPGLTATSLDGLSLAKTVAGIGLVAFEPGLDPAPSFTVPPGTSITGTYRANDIYRPQMETDQSPRTMTFGWITKAPAVTHVLWQVTPYPQVGGANLDPPWLLGWGIDGIDAGSDRGTFEVDTRPYLTAATPVSGPSGWSIPVLTKQLFGQLQVSPNAVLPGVPTAPPIVIPSVGPDLGPPTGTKTVSYAPQHLYVRAIPISGGVPAGRTNDVRFDVVDAPAGVKIPSQPVPADLADTYQVSLGFKPPSPGNPTYERCVLVVDTPTGKTWTKEFWGTYTPGKTVLCYDEPDDSWSLVDAFEAFVEFVEDVWNAVSDGYGWIKQQVVKGILAIAPCKAVASDATCEALATAAVDYLAIAAGVPPSIPDFDTVIAGLKGDLAGAVVGEMSKQVPGIGVACDTANAVKLANCQALVEAAIDKAVGEIKVLRSEAAAANAGVTVPPGVLVVPDPRGQWQPATFTVFAKRSAKPLPPGASCSVSVSMPSVLSPHTWTEVTGYNEWGQVTGTAKGEPFLGESVKLPLLATGETWSREVWLTRQATWFESTAAKVYANWYGDYNHAWVLVQPGAKLTPTVVGPCSATMSGQPVVLQKYAWGGQ